MGSTLITAVSNLLSEYSMQTRTESLMTKRGDQIPNDIARLAGARFVVPLRQKVGGALPKAWLSR